MSALSFDPWAVLKRQREDAALAAAAAHFAKALAHWRDLRFMLEIAEERRLDFLGVRPITSDNGGYHV